MVFDYFLHRYYRLVDGPIDLDTEYCYQATPYGEAVRCKDLPKWLHPLNVATWHPLGLTRHIMEWVACTLGSIILLNVLLRNYQGQTGRKGWARRPLMLLYLGAGLYHIYYYKFYLPLPQRGWATTPCHLGWITRLFMHVMPLTEQMQDVLSHMLLSFSSLAFLFIFEDGEVGDAMYDGIYNWSLIHHSILITIPIYDVCTGRVAALPPPVPGGGRQKSVLKYFIKWHMVSVACYLLLYVTTFTPISLLSGVNWGWTIHFHSTKVAEDIHLTGPTFRLWWFLYFNICFIVFRVSWMILDWTVRASGLSPYSHSNMLRMQMEKNKKAD